MRTAFKRNKRISQKILFIIILVATISEAKAQINMALDISETYDDNVYLSPTPESDYLTDASLGIYLQPKDSALNFQLHSNYFAYAKNSARNLLMNKIQVSYYGPIDSTGVNQYYLGGNWSNRVNTDLYNYYNYNQFYAYSNFFYKLKAFHLRAGYNLRYRDFSNYDALSNWQQYLYFQVHRSFQTRTTLIFESNLGLKTFNGEDSLIRIGSSDRPGGQNVIRVEGENIYLGHAVFMARIAQSLHDRIGLFVQYSRQFSLIEKGSYQNGTVYYQDEELFDDPFSYENDEISTKLSILLPKSFSIQSGVNLMRKQYLTEQAFETESDTIGIGGSREDQKFYYYLNLEKKISTKAKWINTLKVYGRYHYVSNHSNSYWYNYRYNSINFGVMMIF